MIHNKSLTKDILKRISHAGKEQILRVIHSEWESHDAGLWSKDIRLYLIAGKKLLESGQTFLGYDILTEGLKHFPEDISLLQQQARALACLGVTERAQKILLRLKEDGKRDAETMGILARTYKDRWTKTRNPQRRHEFLRLARDTYLEGFKVNKDYYTGINAASMSLFLGEYKKARDIASKVINICQKELVNSTDNYWLPATMGEAYLIHEDYQKAIDYYKKAFYHGRGIHANLAATKKQAYLILKHRESERSFKNKWFDELKKTIDLGNIVFCTGHMIDRANRKEPRFSSSLEEEVRYRIRDALERLNTKIGYSSAANGTDILFIEEMLQRKAEVYVHLPFRREDFIETSVRFAGEGWVKRFNDALKRVTSVIEPVGEAYLGDQCLFDYGNRVIMGKTLLHADTLGLTPHLLAVWDGRPGDAPDGTADTVKTWERLVGKNITIIDISKLSHVKKRNVSDRRSSAAIISHRKDSGSLSREIKSMLFADVVGFSKFQEKQMPYYIYKFMATIGRLITRKKFVPIFNNTWGDSVFFVFNSVSDAAYFALELRDLVLKTDWKKKGLPSGINIRIALHSGPIYSGYDALLGKLNYFGSHVNRSARLEPVTIPGCVYASEPFAALLRAEGIPNLACEYVGQLPMDKDYGIYPVYHIRRVNEVE